MHKCLTECLLKIIKAYINTIFGVRIITLIDTVNIIYKILTQVCLLSFNMSALYLNIYCGNQNFARLMCCALI